MTILYFVLDEKSFKQDYKTPMHIMISSMLQIYKTSGTSSRKKNYGTQFNNSQQAVRAQKLFQSLHTLESIPLISHYQNQKEDHEKQTLQINTLQYKAY